MLRQSPTFRRQCQRIANASWLTVTIVRVVLRAVGGPRARTDIIRHPSGALSATIEVPLLDDDVELIAHEIEHVIEQLDGVDLRSKTAWTDSGVQAFTGSTSMFETLRARRVGLRVAQEVRRPRR